MLVDDHPMMVWSLDILLRTILPDATITTAASARTMRERLIADPRYDCVFLDLSLPDATGAEAIKQCKRVAPLVPIIVFSAQTDSRIRDACFQAGASAFLSKGTGQQDLAGQMQDLLHGGTLNAANAGLQYPSDRESPLSGRVLEVARHVAQGHSNRVIAESMGVKIGTVKVHVSKLLRVLNATNRTEAASILKDLDSVS